jgi:hypothetical protein
LSLFLFFFFFFVSLRGKTRKKIKKKQGTKEKKIEEKNTMAYSQYVERNVLSACAADGGDDEMDKPVEDSQRFWDNLMRYAEEDPTLPMRVAHAFMEMGYRVKLTKTQKRNAQRRRARQARQRARSTD